MLWERSPLNHAGKIRKPLLIGQGANDPRVKQAESDQIISAMRAKDLPVTYVLYPEEGHGFAVPENRLSFQAITEAFLVANLGGVAEPIGKDFEGAKLEVREGAGHIPGLDGALDKAWPAGPERWPPTATGLWRRQRHSFRFPSGIAGVGNAGAKTNPWIRASPEQGRSRSLSPAWL